MAHITDTHRSDLHAQHREMVRAFISRDAAALSSVSRGHLELLETSVAQLPTAPGLFVETYFLATDSTELGGHSAASSRLSVSANPQAPRDSTGPEIWSDTAGLVTHFVAAIGTGGTITETGGYLKSVSSGSPSWAQIPWYPVGLGDLNGAGEPDINWANGTSGQVSSWLLVHRGPASTARHSSGADTEAIGTTPYRGGKFQPPQPGCWRFGRRTHPGHGH